MTFVYVLLGIAAYLICGIAAAHVLAKQAVKNWGIESIDPLNLLIVPLLCLLWPVAPMMVVYYKVWLNAGNKRAALIEFKRQMAQKQVDAS